MIKSAFAGEVNDEILILEFTKDQDYFDYKTKVGSLQSLFRHRSVPDAIDATTLTLEVVTVLPLASTIRITGCVPRTDPLEAPVGWVVIAAAVADAAVTVKLNVRVVLPVELVAVIV